MFIKKDRWIHKQINYKHLYVFGPTAPIGPGPPHSRGFLTTHNDAPQSVGLLWTNDQLVAETSTWQHSQQTNIRASGGIRTHNLNRWAAADLRHRPAATGAGTHNLQILTNILDNKTNPFLESPKSHNQMGDDTRAKWKHVIVLLIKVHSSRYNLPRRPRGGVGV